VSRVNHYRKPRIVKAKEGWYIKYYYRVPLDLREYYDGREWYAFRIKEDMNRRKGEERVEYANWLLEEITNSLKNGYNPFMPAVEETTSTEEKPEDSTVSITRALQIFLDEWSGRGLDKSSIGKYKRYINRLLEWLIEKRIQERDVKLIDEDTIEKFLKDNKIKYKISNREYNNTMLFIRTAFKFLVKKKYITQNPVADVDKQQANTKKHRYYDARSLETITKALKVKDPYCYLAFQTIYHLCIRSEKELMHFKIGNILWDQNKVFVDMGKMNTQRYIPMDENIKQIFLDARLHEYPPEYYVFGAHNKPAANHFGGTFFSRRFSKVRKFIGMDTAYTLYSAKHTRVIHLKQDGATDSDIMSLTGHKDFTAYATYLRNLGLEADPKKLNKLSRKL
jgi:site-specific recombinase XerD